MAVIKWVEFNATKHWWFGSFGKISIKAEIEQIKVQFTVCPIDFGQAIFFVLTANNYYFSLLLYSVMLRMIDESLSFLSSLILIEIPTSLFMKCEFLGFG